MRENEIHARVLKWQALSQHRKMALQKEEQLKQEIAMVEREKRRDADVAGAMKKIPLRYQGKNWADFIVKNSGQEKIKSIVRQYAKTFSRRLCDGNNLIFIGKPKSGKTFLASLLYQQLVQDGFSCLYEPSLDFLRALQEKKFSSPGSFSSAIELYKSVPFLIIDKVTEGSGKDGELVNWERQLLLKIMEARYQQKYCTLIISYLTRPEMAAQLGALLLGQFLENSITLAFTWPSS